MSDNTETPKKNVVALMPKSQNTVSEDNKKALRDLFTELYEREIPSNIDVDAATVLLTMLKEVFNGTFTHIYAVGTSNKYDHIAIYGGSLNNKFFLNTILRECSEQFHFELLTNLSG